MRLDHKVAIITGASSGIGRASALLFAKEGARVVIADLDRTGGEEIVSAITANQGEAIFVATDVTNPSDLENIISQTMAAFSRIDILFNNAGIYMKQTPVEDLEEAYSSAFEP
jgi:NAD(P)-dependent dehydrogenase (short-subunit alcohol dehydrogenase family)